MPVPLFVGLVFVASELLAEGLGVRFAHETLGTLYQYLDPAILREDLLGGLYHLHSQPPVFNLGLGIGLKLFPRAYPLAFDLIWGAFALSLLLGMAWLMRRLEVPDLAGGAVLLLFALSPSFPVYRHWLFYTLPVALLLVAGAVSLVLFLESGRKLALFSFAGAALLVMMTRSVFHPLWLVAVLSALLPFAGPHRRRGLVLGSLAALVLANLWFWKNEILVGSYSSSTWLGLSLAKRWPLSQKEVAQLKASGALPPFWHRRPYQEPRELAPFGFFQDGGTRSHPALDAPYKTNGEPNFNHRDYVAISEALLEGNLHLVRHFPDRYMHRIGTALLLFLQPGPNSVHFLVDYDFERVALYRDLLTRYVFLGGRIERPIQMLDPGPNLLLVVFPLALWMGIRGLRRGPPASRALHAYMLVSVIWLSAVVNLVEIGENDRMRWEIEPFLAIWLGCLAGSLFPKRTVSPSAEAGTA